MNFIYAKQKLQLKKGLTVSNKYKKTTNSIYVVQPNKSINEPKLIKNYATQ